MVATTGAPHGPIMLGSIPRTEAAKLQQGDGIAQHLPASRNQRNMARHEPSRAEQVSSRRPGRFSACTAEGHRRHRRGSGGDSRAAAPAIHRRRPGGRSGAPDFRRTLHGDLPHMRHAAVQPCQPRAQPTADEQGRSGHAVLLRDQLRNPGGGNPACSALLRHAGGPGGGALSGNLRSSTWIPCACRAAPVACSPT